MEEYDSLRAKTSNGFNQKTGRNKNNDKSIIPKHLS